MLGGHGLRGSEYDVNTGHDSPEYNHLSLGNKFHRWLFPVSQPPRIFPKVISASPSRKQTAIIPII